MSKTSLIRRSIALLLVTVIIAVAVEVLNSMDSEKREAEIHNQYTSNKLQTLVNDNTTEVKDTDEVDMPDSDLSGEEETINVEEESTISPDGLSVRTNEGARIYKDVDPDKPMIALSFDDGPNKKSTEKILAALEKYNARATFFVVGKSEKYTPLYRRIVEEGHSIGMHSYSHRYSEIYQDVESFGQDMKRLQQLIYDKTGVISNIYRFPGGSSNTVSKVDMGELIAYLGGQGITYYDWNVSSHDADNNNGELIVDDIVESVTGNIQTRDNSIVLMHDANDKRLTVEALPIIIEKLQAMDHVEILPISEDTAKIQHTTLEEN